MSSGLQRRRVRASSSGTAPSSPVTPTTQNNQTPQDSEAGHKIAYDPDDIPTNSTETKLPRLTLMEEVLLMGIKDKEGYLSFWNDNISYALRGCIILELAFRGKIQMVNDPARRRLELSERNIEVIDSTLTGEVLLDESLKLMKASEPMSVGQWIDLLSGKLLFCCFKNNILCFLQTCRHYFSFLLATFSLFLNLRFQFCVTYF